MNIQIWLLIHALLVQVTYVHNKSRAETNFSKLLQEYERADRPFAFEDKPVRVEINMRVNNLGQFNTQRMQYELTLTLRQKWKDPRLIMRNITRKLAMTYFKEKMWIPDLFFPNSVDGKLQEITVPNYLIWLDPQTGQVHYSQKIGVHMSCILDLHRYPMDDQLCQVDISSYGYLDSDLDLQWMHGNDQPKLNVNFSSNVNLNEFILEKFLTSNDSTCGTSPLGHFPCIQVKFFLRRDLKYYMVHTYFPTILIVTISWLSFLIDFTSAPARITLGLLSVLTLITQSSLVVQTMPKISYVKAIDVWLFTCLAFVILALLEFAFINAVCREGPKPIFNFTRKLAHLSMKRMISTAGIDSKKSGHSMNQENTFPIEENGNDQQDESDCSDVNVNNEQFGLLANISLPKTVGYKVDGVFFAIYPLLFTIFNIIYWSIYYQHDAKGV